MDITKLSGLRKQLTQVRFERLAYVYERGDIDVEEKGIMPSSKVTYPCTVLEKPSLKALLDLKLIHYIPRPGLPGMRYGVTKLGKSVILTCAGASCNDRTR